MRLFALLIAVASALFGAGLHDRFDPNGAREYNAKVAGFGERWPGSPGHAKTQALIRQVLARNGALIESDDFSALTPRGPVQVHNIIGRFGLVRSDPQPPILILAGHYDTLFQPGFIGANDAGSSTAILLAFADALAHQTLNVEVWLVWTDLEEAISSFTADDGLYGSRHLAKKLKDDGTAARIKGFFLLDMIADASLNVARETGSNRLLQERILTAAKRLGYESYFFKYEASIVDDHVPFIEAGIPAVDIVDAQYGRMGPSFDGMGEFHHSNLDTIDKISQASLEIVGKTVLQAIELFTVDSQSRIPAVAPIR